MSKRQFRICGSGIEFALSFYGMKKCNPESAIRGLVLKQMAHDGIFPTMCSS